MALTRALLKGFGLNDEQISAIIEAHTDTVDGLKETIKELKNSKEPEKHKKETKNDEEEQKKEPEKSEWEKKFEEEHKNFETFKQQQMEKANKEAKENAYRLLLKESGVSDKRIDTVIKVTDFSKIELEESGELKGKETLTESIKKDWSDFIVQKENSGAGTQNPPQGAGTGSGKEQFSGLAGALAQHYAEGK